ncbi:MAG: hypothetical protein K2J39_06740, partial [Ruminococcus sp.]|nr:hypothetical protein [Ruminococcus sp.]
KEISDWIESHEDSASAMNSAISANTIKINNKVDKVSGKGLSTNDFTTALKNKLDGLENYDDTKINAEITETTEQTALNCSTLGYQKKNLLKNTAISRTQSGVTFTVNEDGSVNVNGTATGNTFFYINSNFAIGNKPAILSGCPAGGGVSRYQIDMLDNDNISGIIAADTGSGKTIDKSMFETGTATVRIRINNGTVVNNLVFKPMIRYAEIADDTYEPYKPSIEERLEALENAISGGISND